MKVRKAVIVAAGWGTRFLPLTRSQPKEMLPLVDKPLIHYAVEEAIDAGIDDIILITALGKYAIENYFDRSPELECFLEKKGQTKLLEQTRALSGMVDICYVRQKEQLGLGHAVLAARKVVGDQAFAVILPDDIIEFPETALKQMVRVFDRYQASVVAVERVTPEKVNKYGIIAPGAPSGRVFPVRGLVEKPEPAEAPSDLGIVGRYILTPAIFDAIAATPPGRNGEIQLTDAMQLLTRAQPVYAYEFEGVRYDVGNPLGLLKATIALALKRPDMGPELRSYLRGMLDGAG
ncbi:MAG: UTP--glucose-1-phosphate uridylyltransferase GalU [Chloroflexi bacterium]|nr:UTP--glucose-1-phosphate uridylyltransferase GalU [Chloroflexota bacterium]